MKPKIIVIGLLAAGVLGASGYGLYMLGMQRGMGSAGAASPIADAPSQAATVDPSGWTMAQGEEASRRHIKEGIKAGNIDPATGRRILYYHDPMVPGKKFDAPGKSPYMDMMLVPAYAGSEGADDSKVTVSSRVQQNIGLRTALVVEGTLAPEVSAVGAIAYNERDQAVVQVRAMGYVEKLYVRATLDHVAKGQPLVDLYVPDWVAAQEEFLSVRRMQGTDLAPLINGARARMRQAGMGEEHIRLVESTGRVQARLTIHAPISGVLTELVAREGMTMAPGMTAARINGLETVWANAEVPESQAALLRPGSRVSAKSPALPGVTFEGRVQALLPEVNPATRTVKARMELANPGARLVPGMFVQMNFTDRHENKILLVPSEAVIQTGKRALVMAADEGGKFHPVAVETGIESGGQTEIRKGLLVGQKVVLSGQFLIDSEASLKGLVARLGEGPGERLSTAPAAGDTHRTEAQVEAIKDGMVTLSHPPIPSLQWPAMTMDFRLPADGGQARNLHDGDKVAVEFRMQKGGAPLITTIRRLAAGQAVTKGAAK
jgi:Cu(I)/Ag(I) efflux system membrane fusion protein